jgi:hypothetical protein
MATPSSFYNHFLYLIYNQQGAIPSCFGKYFCPVRLAYQPPASSTFLSEQTSHQQLANNTLLSKQTSTSHQPPAKRTG